MRRRVILMVSSLLLLPPGSRAGSEEFQDYARVVDVEPIVAPKSYRPESKDCEGQAGALDTDPFEGFAASIGADVRRQNLRNARLGPTGCSQAQASRIIGYRVTYRYRGKTLVRHLQQPPQGDLPVRVRVRALP